MLMAHHLVDILMGRVEKPRGFIMPRDVPEEDMREFGRLIEMADKFDFGSIILETDLKRDVAGDPTWIVPELTSDEEDFFKEGLLPLPSPVTWFEFTLRGYRSGLLLLEDLNAKGKCKYTIQRVDYDPGKGTGVWDTVILMENDNVEIVATILSPNMSYNFHNDPDLIKNMSYGGNVGLSLYLLLMLNSKSTEVKKELAPVKLNRARVKRGVTPLADHRIVHIVPKHYLDAAEKEAADEKGERRRPRLHWRRSHVRTYQSGKRIVIARMLVAKASLGEVSHEYKVGK